MLHKHFGHVIGKMKAFLGHAYHHTKQFLHGVDFYAGMFKCVLAAAQPALQDMGIPSL